MLPALVEIDKYNTRKIYNSEMRVLFVYFGVALLSNCYANTSSGKLAHLYIKYSAIDNTQLQFYRISGVRNHFVIFSIPKFKKINKNYKRLIFVKVALYLWKFNRYSAN